MPSSVANTLVSIVICAPTPLGLVLGLPEGVAEGDSDDDGDPDAEALGLALGEADGVEEADELALALGEADGVLDGLVDGELDDEADGVPEGDDDGVDDGELLGLVLGEAEVEADGDAEGLDAVNGYASPLPLLYSSVRSSLVNTRFQNPTSSINPSKKVVPAPSAPILKVAVLSNVPVVCDAVLGVPALMAIPI